MALDPAATSAVWGEGCGAARTSPRHGHREGSGQALGLASLGDTRHHARGPLPRGAAARPGLGRGFLAALGKPRQTRARVSRTRTRPPGGARQALSGAGAGEGPAGARVSHSARARCGLMRGRRLRVPGRRDTRLGSMRRGSKHLRVPLALLERPQLMPREAGSPSGGQNSSWRALT
jgi:hypothetical protein